VTLFSGPASISAELPTISCRDTSRRMAALSASPRKPLAMCSAATAMGPTARSQPSLEGDIPTAARSPRNIPSRSSWMPAVETGPR
jgi:hypothetical protein